MRNRPPRSSLSTVTLSRPSLHSTPSHHPISCNPNQLYPLLQNELDKQVASTLASLPGYVPPPPEQPDQPNYLGLKLESKVTHSWNGAVDSVFRPLLKAISERGI